MIWYTNGYDYPLVIGGKPLFAWEFSIPVMFELTVLLSAFGAVFGMFALNGLPKFYHPIFDMEGWERATDDRYMLVIEAPIRSSISSRLRGFCPTWARCEPRWSKHEAADSHLCDGSAGGLRNAGLAEYAGRRLFLTWTIRSATSRKAIARFIRAGWKRKN